MTGTDIKNQSDTIFVASASKQKSRQHYPHAVGTSFINSAPSVFINLAVSSRPPAAADLPEKG